MNAVCVYVCVFWSYVRIAAGQTIRREIEIKNISRLLYKSLSCAKSFHFLLLRLCSALGESNHGGMEGGRFQKLDLDSTETNSFEKLVDVDFTSNGFCCHQISTKFTEVFDSFLTKIPSEWAINAQFIVPLATVYLIKI